MGEHTTDKTPKHDIPPNITEVRTPEGVRRVELTGMWNLRNLCSRWRELNNRLKNLAIDETAEWDLRKIDVLDNAGAVLLWRAWGQRLKSKVLLQTAHVALFDHLKELPEYRYKPRRFDPAAFFVWLGIQAYGFVEHLLGVITLLGNVILAIGYILRHPARIPWREISANVFRTGAQALGITALVGFLVGVVLSYLSTKQLRVFGADIYIVNILGISILRELGPVLAAILVAGRSGSSMTAQLGVMRVTQELDALSVMGIPHSLRLVLPKIMALTLALPLLILWTNSIALFGGALAAQLQLDLKMQLFIERLPDAVPIANFWLGIGKGTVFGFLIALIACHFGLRIRPNTESLGAGTTSSVVTAITIVILADAVFAILFSDIGIR